MGLSLSLGLSLTRPLPFIGGDGAPAPPGVAVEGDQITLGGWPYFIQGAAEEWSARFIEPNEYRMEVRPGDNAAFDSDSPVTVERSQFSSQTKMSELHRYEILFDVKVDHPNGVSAASFFNIYGLHQYADAHDAPTINGSGIPGPFRLTLRPDGDLEAIRGTSTQDPLVDQVPTQTTLYKQPFSYGVRHTILFDVIPHRSAGSLRCWIIENAAGAALTKAYIKANGTLVAEYTGAVGYPDAVGSYHQMQAYRSAGDPDPVVVTYWVPATDHVVVTAAFGMAETFIATVAAETNDAQDDAYRATFTEGEQLDPLASANLFQIHDWMHLFKAPTYIAARSSLVLHANLANNLRWGLSNSGGGFIPSGWDGDGWNFDGVDDWFRMEFLPESHAAKTAFDRVGVWIAPGTSRAAAAPPATMFASTGGRYAFAVYNDGTGHARLDASNQVSIIWNKDGSGNAIPGDPRDYLFSMERQNLTLEVWRYPLAGGPAERMYQGTPGNMAASAWTAFNRLQMGRSGNPGSYIACKMLGAGWFDPSLMTTAMRDGMGPWFKSHVDRMTLVT